MKYRLQQYTDGSFGYLSLDGDNYFKFLSDARVLCTQGEDEYREDFIKNNRIEFIKNQYGSNWELDVLVNDKNWEVRASIIEKDYALDKLIWDKDWRVRELVLKHGYGLDILINDTDYLTRRVLARRGYGLDILVNDEHPHVRQAVIEQGYGLDKLINDKDEMVRMSVHEYLVKNHLTILQWKDLHK